MLSEFFIKRPVFATVCSLLIILVGTVALPTLPIEYYPNVTPPTIQVASNFAGASAETVETNVTTILETAINGVEGMDYIDSTSDNFGNSNLTITFTSGYSQDIAAVDVNNDVASVLAQLPQSVQATGVTVTKASPQIVTAIGLYSPDDRYDSLFISNYASLYITQPLQRLSGVGQVQIFGQRTYAMRLWLDPARLAARGLTATDVTNALADQNIQVGAGIIGAPPAPSGQEFQISIQAQSRLASEEEFGDIVIQRGEDGSLIRVRDVGRTELGAQSYTTDFNFDGKDAVGVGIYQLNQANALDIYALVDKEMTELAKSFPPGLEWAFGFSTTNAVEESQKEVVETLYVAIILVVLVIFLFLQDWRSTLIPLITIPVSLIGTFAFMVVFQFSLNSLTMFGLVLATGLVVDDAIIVVENVTRLMQERNMTPMEAAIESMREVSGAIIATSLVLMAVFIPVAFFPGVTGQLYQQFALTIVFSIAFSTFNALTLSPPMSALLLRREKPPVNNPVDRLLTNFIYRPINVFLDWLRSGYEHNLTVVVTKFKGVVLIGFVVLLGLTYWLFNVVPPGFIPEEDQGYFVTLIQSPQGVSIEYTNNIVREAAKIISGFDEIIGPDLPPDQRGHTFAITGNNFFGNGPDKGVIYTSMQPWSKRRSLDQILPEVQQKLGGLTGAIIFVTNVPAVNLGGSGLGGFDVQVMDQQNLGFSALNAAVSELVRTAASEHRPAGGRPGLLGVNTPFADNAPLLSVDVDRTRALALNVNLNDVFNTMQVYLGSAYVNQFNLFARSYQVIIQADQQFRSNPDDINKLYVRSVDGNMIPLSNLVTVKQITAPPIVYHHNLFRSAEVTGSGVNGLSDGQAMNIISTLAEKILPRGINFAWTGLSLESTRSGGQAPFIFALGLIFVFLILSAQYESYIDPLIILLSVPLAVLGALLAQEMRGLANDLFCQIGLVMLIGLASKNAILIVEFANQIKESEGVSATKAVIKAAEERLRPILMTAISFILGILPLVFASGSGSNARHSLGTAVLGGMIASTLLSFFIVPVIYIVIKSLEERLSKPAKKPLEES
ncbi:efflux RND transporter permease subunit [Thermosynechococcaceae cyanobacterium BACA0444]|uniref:Efflux RND transporter permease subunit n=1 Tax=Pseudocalidococcus azoricus BACA0444 TaxID=2918990 RepID=A0AAE4FSY3_9CYAN|nr:efflux RND transporter permease subunit [Pseudocalidococcus azoricus]MDS3861233.1 efflux RND transporter permease subunit [Pseudocalidococcus azoricus BACA0444]